MFNIIANFYQNQKLVGFIMRRCYVYILANRCRTSMLTGLTGDLRTFLTTDSVALHRKPRLKEADLLYYETFMNVQQAVRREKQLKNWKIGWKLELIRRLNPDLKALQL